VLQQRTAACGNLLAANLIGGYIIGLAIAFFSSYTDLSPELRLVIVTGLCGGLTTFSTFSAELVALMQQERLLAIVCSCGSPSWRLGHHDVRGNRHDCVDQELRT
jgi:Integral membrane protein possibly involved in chromosome condensation